MMQAAAARNSGGGISVIEQCITIADLAGHLRISLEKARLVVMHEPGVIRIRTMTASGKLSRKSMYRIPESVAARIVRRFSNPA